MKIHELQQATSQHEHLQCLKEYIIQGWPETRDQIPQDIKAYWTFQGDMAVIERLTLKGRHTVIPQILQKQMLQQLHINHMAVEKTNLLAF